MSKIMATLFLIIVIAATLGYWRGWFSVTKNGKLDVQLDRTNFQEDRDAFTTSVREKAVALKADAAKLWHKVDGLSTNEKKEIQNEIDLLNTKHDRIETQIEALNQSKQVQFETLRLDLSTNLTDIDNRLQTLQKKFEPSK
jgi:hypothetical protein